MTKKEALLLLQLRYPEDYWTAPWLKYTRDYMKRNTPPSNPQNAARWAFVAALFDQVEDWDSDDA